ncbi:putative DNA modification/repair radical SAM protein [Phragmitibacter flavus]|uniref:Putative DNA modification/repair radical SAM protein n=1 Tax=Phragmitibacter flavus TaxID=2576071 RepID=A0A5R8KJ25_9BACT|nr:putative DNA modification/repair radical SAM protein [Phragmitibacter flavus]TLD72260.1 putative DNA modification/repair radical SAM protein [Phragmitibacter flavus]
MQIRDKLSILADAAKYDASCASSGTNKRDSRAGGLGSTTGMGICHSYTPDGRCVSLLKILMTNSCIYNCLYCINRSSSNVRRARFTPEEVVDLTLDFYRRNYIEGLFLSSGIVRSSNHTMEQVVRVAKTLRVDHQFRGYIHLKTIPEAAPELIEEAGRWADRLSINVELPTPADLDQLAPEKNLDRIRGAMTVIGKRITQAKIEKRENRKASAFSPAGQSTQMIVGATPTADRAILDQASSLYQNHQLKRVYYSAFSPIPDASSQLPLISPPLVREHRLYQADWLLRFYGFKVTELTTPDSPNLPLDIDPKLAWALNHRDEFPTDINRAPRETLLRVPGLGVRNVDRILQIRRWHTLRLTDLMRMRMPMKKVLPFIITADHTPHRIEKHTAVMARSEKQMELFAPDVFTPLAVG